ncbi:hypothetical protein DRE_03299 [Drechslerella stenobrocha 248]|uniref:Rhodopsin domain-containing protein n=1 Tax=Drechslerella stenobrocha 248 TaxID=1043628 RepID=W7HVX3_9PEZI|nr:hypothetical protein DRE_03299 [Drechslerella stenobrocha 248]
MENGGSFTTLLTAPIAILATTSTAIAATTTDKLYSTETSIASAGDGSSGNHGPTVSATTIVFLVLAFVSVSLRIIARGFISRRMRIDDYLILVAFALSFGMCLSIILGVTHGFGRHSNTIPYATALQKQKYQYAFTLLFNPAIAVTKASILTFYLLVFKVQKHFRRFCWLTMAVVLAAGLALTLLLAFRCQPIGLVFDPESNRQPFPGCIGTVRIYFASAPVNILEDLAIIVLPIPVLTSLRLPNRQKAILLVVFSLGVFDIVVGIIRIHYFQLTETQELDFDYNAAYSFMWAAIEVNVGIVCASIPMTKPLIYRFFPSWLGSPSISDTNIDNGHYESTYAYGVGSPIVPITRRGTIGSTSHRPSIGIGWLSAYGDSHGTIGELGHVDTDGKIITPNREARDMRAPANRLEAALSQDNIYIKTPPGTLSKINERRERRVNSLEDSAVSGSTAVTRQSEASSYSECVPTSSKSQTPPWENMELAYLGSDDVDPLDSRAILPHSKQPTDFQDSSDDIPPWEKLELPGLDDPSLMGLEAPCKPKDTPGSSSEASSSARREERSRQIRKTSTSSTGSSTRASSSFFSLARSRSKTKIDSLSLEIPRRRSSQIQQVLQPGSRKASQDNAEIAVTPTLTRHRSTRTVAEPLLPPASPTDDYLMLVMPESSKKSRLGLSEVGKASTEAIPERAETAGYGPAYEEDEPWDIAQTSAANQTQVQIQTQIQNARAGSETPPWEYMEFEDVSGKGKAPSSSTPDDAQ